MKTRYRKVFVDANVILDLYDVERTFHFSSVEALKYLIKSGAKLYTSSEFVTLIYYVLSKKKGKEAINDVENLLELFILIPFSNEELAECIKIFKENENFKDFEDTLHYILAQKEKCDLILSNDKAFYSPNIKVLSSQEFIELRQKVPFT